MKLQRLKGTLQSMPASQIQRQPEATTDPNSWRAGLGKTSDRGYGWRWQQARKTYLGRPENVCCRLCASAGLVVLAAVVDHIEPHRGDQEKFWDTANWQPLCKTCHDAKTAAGG